MTQSRPVLAFDIGGSNVKAALVLGAEVSGLSRAPTTRVRTAPELINIVASLGRRVASVYGPASLIGVSVRGVVEPESGRVIDVNEPLGCLVGTAPARILEQRFGLPAAIDNDARMYAAGELSHGAGRGLANLVCVTLGTGVGVGVVVDGQLWRGPFGARGILAGHVTVDFDGPLCGCGNVGCLEALVGGRALADQLRERLTAGVPSSLAPGGVPVDGLDASAIFAAAAAGDVVAGQVVERFGRALGAGIVTLIHAYDPDLVVLGGGLTASAGQYLGAVRRWVSEHAWTVPRRRMPIVLAELGDGAALVGVAALANGSLEN